MPLQGDALCSPAPSQGVALGYLVQAPSGHRIRAQLTLALLAALIAAASAHADWPIFRGNAMQSGVAEGKLPAKLDILWQAKLGDAIEGAPAIADGVVYIGNFDENLYALDLASGQQKWKVKAGPTKAPPSIHKGNVYIGDENGIFHCIDAGKGTSKWTYETDGEITSGANFAGDRILFGSHDSTLYCLSADGKLQWKFQTEGPVNGSPVVIGERTFVAGCDSNLHVIDLKSGKSLVAVDLGGQAGATAAVANDKLYVGTMTNQVQAVDLKKNQIAWTYEAKRRAQPFYGSAAVSDKLVVVGSRDRVLHAIDRATGTPAWVFPTEGAVDCSPVIVGDRVVFGSSDGNFYVVDLKTGTEIQRLPLGGRILGSPAVSDGKVVVGTTDGVLYCLGAKK